MSIKPDVPLDKWCQMYKISKDPIKCGECNELVAVTIPIAIKGYRGVEAEKHGSCSNQPFRVVPWGDEEVSFWQGIKEGFAPMFDELEKPEDLQ